MHINIGDGAAWPKAAPPPYSGVYMTPIACILIIGIIHLMILIRGRLVLDAFHKTRKGGWLGGSSPDFHALTLHYINCPKHADLVLSVGGGVGGCLAA